MGGDNLYSADVTHATYTAQNYVFQNTQVW